MRLLFAYFDFTYYQGMKSFRGLEDCSLNFSTTHDYRIERTVSGGKNQRKYQYTLSREEKPKDEQLPKGFWGDYHSDERIHDDRIYNVTAIVGENGTGKSTLLHCLIRAVVKGGRPDFPFILVFQKTGSDCLFMYCGEGSSSNDVSFRCSDSIPKEQIVTYNVFQKSYPQILAKMKCLLIDNTLSTSSIELDQLYMWFYQDIQSKFQKEKDDIKEPNKQIYNRSLATSIRTNLMTSGNGRNDHNSSVLEELSTHFRYETYQELRFLFDEYNLDLLEKIKKDGFDVPLPRQVSVHFPDPNSYLISYTSQELHDNSDLAIITEYYEKGDFVGQLLSKVFCSLSIALASQTFFKNNSTLKSILSVGDTPLVDIAKKLIKRIKIEKNENVDKANLIEKYKSFISFVSEKQDILERLFELYFAPPMSYQIYTINLHRAVNDKKQQECFVKFLDKYRAISDQSYFITFTTGLSSGEKNMLHMMTQFRYLLDGPATYEERYQSGDEVPNVLRNSELLFDEPLNTNILDIDDKGIICDTLLLFLDEADLTYHPEWQRKFVSVLTAFLPRMFKSPYSENASKDIGCKDIQVILATHSPLMLGDFPKASTIYLKKNKETDCTEVDYAPRQSSFGQNLYIMLKDDFFMTDTIGEFAKRKINAAAEWCGKVSTSKKSFEDKIKALTEKEKKALEKEKNALEEKEKQARKKWLEELPMHRATAQLLPPGIIRGKLTSELDVWEDYLGGGSYNRLLKRKRQLEAALSKVEKDLESMGGGNASNT